MQYALFEISDKKILMDVAEHQSLLLYEDNIKDQPFPDENSLPFYLCYGKYMNGSNHVSEEETEERFFSAVGHWLGTVILDKSYFIAFHSVEGMPPRHKGHQIYMPFAALIQADQKVIDLIANQNSCRAVTSFVRFITQMTPATNVLNRPGVFAFKGIEKRKTKNKTISKDNWTDFIDWPRMKRTASDIF